MAGFVNNVTGNESGWRKLMAFVMFNIHVIKHLYIK